MRSNKRYTNTTFTKRVDHEAGQHHTPRAAREPATCSACGAVYLKRRWTITRDDEVAQEPRHWRPARVVLCPACKQKHEGDAGGFVTIQGNFFRLHRDQIVRLLRNEATRTAEDNPLAQIMSWRDSQDGKLVLTTTTEHLAQRLGHALEKAFGGAIAYDFSHENKLARVNWQRD